MPSRVVIEVPKSPTDSIDSDNLYSPSIPEVENFMFKPPSSLTHGASGGDATRRNNSPVLPADANSGSISNSVRQQTKSDVSIILPPQASIAISGHGANSLSSPTLNMVPHGGVVGVLNTSPGSYEPSSGTPCHPEMHQPEPTHNNDNKRADSPANEAKNNTGAFSPPSHCLNLHCEFSGKNGNIPKGVDLATFSVLTVSANVSEVELVSVNASKGIQEKTKSSISGSENDFANNVSSHSEEAVLLDPRMFSPRKVRIDTSVSSNVARDTSATKFGGSSSILKKKADDENDDVAYIDTTFSIPVDNVQPSMPAGAHSAVPIGSDGSIGEDGSDPSPKKRAAVCSKLSYPALPLKRKPMMKNRVQPFNFSVRPEYDSLLEALTSLFLCREINVDPDFTKVHSLRDTKEKGRVNMGTSVSEIDDDDDEDDDYVPVFFAPIWLMNVLVLIVIGLSLIVFAFPGLLDVSMLWSSGELHAVDSLLPIVVYLMAVAARAFSNSHGLLLDRTNKHHMIHPVFQETLSSYFIDLERHKVENMAASKKKGLLVKRKTVRALHASLKNEERIVEGASDGGTVFRAALYTDMISSNASLTATQETRSTTGLFSFGVPVLVGVSPIIGRVVDGGSAWASGSIPELALVVFGTLLTIIAAHTLTNMINLHLETLTYHGIMAHRITAALPVQSTAHHEDHLTKFFPKIPFNSIGNIMAWHRMRWVLGEAPHPLVHFGSLVFQSISIFATIFISFSIISNYSQGDGKFTGAASGIATMLVFLLPTVAIGLLRLPLRINYLLSSHVSMLSQIILESLGHDSTTAQAKVSKQTKGDNNSYNNAPSHREINPLAGPTLENKHNNGLMTGGGGTNFLANSAFLTPEASNIALARSHSHRSGGSQASFASSVASEGNDLAFQQHLKLREVVRDIASALPHHTKLYTFLGFQVTPTLLLVLAFVYIVFAMASVDLLVRRFSD